MVKDCLTLNDCIVALHERELAARRRHAVDERDLESIPTLLPVNCAGHSGVLSGKPVFSDTPGLSSFVVRIGHLVQSSRPWGRLLDALEAEFDASFQWRPVLGYPDGFDQWGRTANAVLQLSKPALDLSDAVMADISYYDNSNWDEEGIIHYCIAGCRCGRTQIGAREKTKGAVLASLGGGCCLALLYRWKGIEQASAYIYRGRRQHDLLGRAFKRAFDPARVARAEADMANQLDGDNAANRQCIKAGKVNEYIALDPFGRSLQICLVLNAPIQSFMNLVFKAERLVNTYSSSCIRTSYDADKHTAEVREQRDKAASANLEIVSGAAGKRVVSAYLSLACDFNHATWKSLALPRPSQFQSSLGALRCAGVAYRRLVMYYDQPRYKLLTAGGIDTDDLDGQRLARHADLACRHCSDENFSRVWAKRLMHPSARIRRLARVSLRTVLALLPLASVRAERKHLMGQESRKAKSRGAAPGAQELLERTYAKSLSLKHYRDCEAVKVAVLGDSHAARKRFGRMFAAAASRKRTVGGRHKHVKARVRSQRAVGSKQTGLQAYKTENWACSAKVGSLENQSEHRRLHAAYARLSPAEVAHWEAKAAAVTENRRASPVDFGGQHARKKVIPNAVSAKR